MRAPTRLSLAVAGLLALSCSKGESAFEVLVNVGSGATANCINVAVWAQPNAQIFSNNFSNTGSGPYKVAVYQGKLADAVSVEAFGYGDSACTVLTSQSGPSPAVFGQTSSLGLTLFGLQSTDGGSDGGSDGGGGLDGGPPPDSGTTADAGGADAGGPDAGGSPDSGIPDAGPSCSPKSWPGSYTPSNVDLTLVPCVNASMLIDCVATVDTTAFPSTGNLTLCGRQLTAALLNQNNGTNPVQVVVIASASLDVLPDAGATFQGPYPVVLAVYGNATVDGVLSAGAGSDAGPGADRDSACNAVAGTNTGAGGGGGYGTNGGNGGGNPASQGKQVGANMNPLKPLEGGCSGASGASGGGGIGGGAGGALQISASGQLSVTGTIASSGSGGLGGGANNPGYGGGGGGSGGALLLEGNRVSLDVVAGQRAAALTVNGGAGGGGGNPGGPGSAGSPGNLSSNVAAGGGAGSGNAGGGGSGGAMAMPTDGMGPSPNGGGGGGGGSVGYIRINATNAGGCNLSSGTTRSGNISSNGSPGCN
jgi:hypothetical protein